MVRFRVPQAFSSITRRARITVTRMNGIHLCSYWYLQLHSGILKVSSCPPVESTGKGEAKVGNSSPGCLPEQGLAPGGCFTAWVTPKVLSTNRLLQVPPWNFKYLKPRKIKEQLPDNFEYSSLERKTGLAGTTRLFFPSVLPFGKIWPKK